MFFCFPVDGALFSRYGGEPARVYHVALLRVLPGGRASGGHVGRGRRCREFGARKIYERPSAMACTAGLGSDRTKRCTLVDSCSRRRC